MRFAVLGGGFGLYGWLPAATVVPAATVATLARYKSRLLARPELVHLVERVRFVEELDDLLDMSDCLIVARRPLDQSDIVAHLVRRHWRGCVVLEKPLAPDPIRAFTLLETLSNAGLHIAAGFVMDKTEWGSALAASFVRDYPTRVDISWTFLAHHYCHSLNVWKRRPSDGGGALRFFAIHFVALLAKLGDWSVIECSRCKDDDDDPAVSFIASNGNTQVHVLCDSTWHGEPAFSVACARGGRTLWNRSLPDPFVEETDQRCASNADRRVFYLASFLTDVATGKGNDALVLKRYLSFWRRLETASGRL